MTLFPAILLLLGAIVLTVWRPPVRAGRLVGPSVAVAAVLTGLLAAGSVPAVSLISIWPPELLPGGQMQFALTPTTWPMGIVLLSVAAVATAIDQRNGRAQTGAIVPAWLTFAAASSMALAAADLLTVVLAWSAAILAERWHVSVVAKEAGEERGAVRIRGIDLASVLLLVGVSSIPDGHPVRLAVVVAACFTRAVASSPSRSRLEVSSEATELLRPVITAISLLAFLSWAVGPAYDPSVMRWLGWGGAGLLWLAAVALVVRPVDRGSVVGWIAACGGAALVGAGATPEGASRSLAGAGLLLAYGGVMGLYRTEPSALRRAAAGLTALSVAGLPLTSGAVLVGSLIPLPDAVDLLLWVGLLGLGIAGSHFLDLARPPLAASEARSDLVGVVSLVWMTVLLAWLYRNAGGREIAPPMVFSAVVLAGLAGGAALMTVLGPNRRGRLSRAVRLPQTAALTPLTEAVRRPVQSWIRSARDILEGDAAVLWSFVVLLIVLLVVRSTT